MDKREALGLLDTEVSRLRGLSYGDLKNYFGGGYKEVTGASGKTYQIETEALYDGRDGSTIRIIVSIDDGGLRAFVPLSRDFIVGPDGSFVGE